MRWSPGWLKIAGLALSAGIVSALLTAGSLHAADEEGARFAVTKIDIRGNTILSEAELATFRAEHEGRTLGLDDVQKIATALEKVYQARGYVARVVFPPQDVSDGTLDFQVIEARIGKISVEGEGETYFDPERNYLRYLAAEGALLNLRDVRESLAVINAHPDKSARANLDKGEAEGTTDILLTIREEHPLHFSIGLDNTGTENTPRLRATATVQYDNFFDLSQIGIFQFTWAPEDYDMVKQYAASYLIPLEPLGGPLGHSLNLYGAYSDASTETILGLLEMHGEGSVLGAVYSFPIPEVLSFKQRVSLGLEWQKLEDTTEFGGATWTDEIRKLSLLARWRGIRRDRLWDRPGTTLLSLGLRYQKDQLFYDFDTEDYRSMRTETDADFWSAAIGLQRHQALWRQQDRVVDGSWSGHIICQAQVSKDRLVPSEQFGLGGYNTVRGYEHRTVTADEGLNVRTELYAPPFRQFLPETVNERIQLLAFLDGGWARNHDPAAGEIDYENMAGAGFGVRVRCFDSAFIGRADAGWALNDLESTEETEAGHLIIHFGVQCRF